MLGGQLLGVARCGFQDFGSQLSTLGVIGRNGLSRSFVANAAGIRPFLPLGAKRVGLDLPSPMEHGPAGRLVESCPIARPVDDALTCRSTA